MKSNLLMNFTLDKENKTVHVKRGFNASLDHVWSAWTEAEILDQWWAPAPFKSKTKSMQFAVGARRLYAMVGPDNQERWGSIDYTSISPKTNFKYAAAFCDSNGIADSNMGSSYWDITFSEQGNSVIVDIAIKRDSLSELEKIIEMGFKQGFTSAMESLDKIFEAQK
jgi:uncharacterized protein YndB with AHSA1/START domain